MEGLALIVIVVALIGIGVFALHVFIARDVGPRS
jgi:hypothetical protein